MQPGQQIRDYVLGQRIGVGGMGEVWSATHQVLHRRVAIKAMSAQLAADPHFEERFVQEARAQAILQHPRILGVTDFFREGGVYYLVMPLVTGRSLEERLAEVGGPLPLDESARIASDILDALDYAHQKGIIHRDVKPSNILLDHDGRAYLTDFGIALLVGQDRRTRTGTSLGTPHYMAPEQIRAPRTIDHRADVYSAACVLYEMLAGRPPFLPDESAGDTDFAVKEAHLRHDPQPVRAWNPAVSPATDAVVLRGLAKDPNQRFGGCGEFRRALEAAAAGIAPPPLPAHHTPPPLPGPMPPPFLPTPAPRPSGSRTGLWVVVGCSVLLGLAVLAGVIAAVINWPPDEPVTYEKSPPLTTEAVFEPPEPPEPPKSQLGGAVAKVWVDHNVERDGRVGMLIHTGFSIAGARQESCEVAAYFYSAAGEPLKDFDDEYKAPDGQAALGEKFTPQYDDTLFEDFKLYMPYDELHMAKGDHSLKFIVKLYHYPSATFVAQSDFVNFTLNQP